MKNWSLEYNCTYPYYDDVLNFLKPNGEVCAYISLRENDTLFNFQFGYYCETEKDWVTRSGCELKIGKQFKIEMYQSNSGIHKIVIHIDGDFKTEFNIGRMAGYNGHRQVVFGNINRRYYCWQVKDIIFKEDGEEKKVSKVHEESKFNNFPRVENSRPLLYLTSNKNYLKHAKQVFYSSKKFGNWNHDMALLIYDVEESDSELDWFKERGIFIFTVPDISDFFSVEREEMDESSPSTGSRSLYARCLLLLEETFSERWTNFVYLDVDTMVVRDINCLSDLKGFYAVKDRGDGRLLQNQFNNFTVIESDIKKDLGVALNKESFNSGVLVFDSSVVTKEN